MNNLTDLIKQAHEMRVKQGFWNCPVCEGNKEKLYEGRNGITLIEKCIECDGTGIDLHANIPEKLMQNVIEPLGRACEALRKNNRCPYKFPDHFDARCFNRFHFESVIKDTFEDFLATACIGLMDLCGYLQIEPYMYAYADIGIVENISESLFTIVEELIGYNITVKEQERKNWAGRMFNLLYSLCENLNIDIDKHITAKLAYLAGRKDGER